MSTPETPPGSSSQRSAARITRNSPPANSTATTSTSPMTTPGRSAKPISRRKIKRYFNKNLLSLPDEVLAQIASYLLPLPPQNPPVVTSLKNALSLSLTCKRFHDIVISRLHTLDFIAPSSYTSFTCRTPKHVSSQLERFIKSASNHLEDLRLPQGYVPSDGRYTVIGKCKRLTHLALPVSKLLNSQQVQDLFSKFENLNAITLDLPSPAFLIGLCGVPVHFKEATFTRLPAEDASFTSLSAFLIKKGLHLTKLSINLLCEDSKTAYLSTKRAWLWNNELRPSDRALPRLASVLQRHVGSNELPALRELDVSTIPDMPVKRAAKYNLSHLQVKVALFTQAIKTARLQNSQPKGLKKLRMSVLWECRHICISFMSRWIDPEVEVEVSLPGCTVVFPRDSPEGTFVPKVKEIMLWPYPGFLYRLFPDVEYEINAIGIGNRISTFSNSNCPQLSAAVPFIQATHGETVKTLRIASDVSKGSVFKSLKELLGVVEQVLPTLVTLELPAEVVFFSASPNLGKVDPGLVSNSNRSVKILRLYGFREGNVTMFDQATSAWRYPVHRISIDRVQEKAARFLTCLPQFLLFLRKDFPNLELLYMEETTVEQFNVDRTELHNAMYSIGTYEKASGADASTLRTEIMEWRKRPMVTGSGGYN